MAAHFTPDMQDLMEILNLFPQLNPNDEENSTMNFQSLLGFSHDNFLAPMPEFPGNLADNFPGFFCDENKSVVPPAEPVTISENDMRKGKKRKSLETPESSSANSPLPASENGTGRKNSSGRGKRVKSNEKEEEKNKEVVHVRVRRGQATDSHSLAERLRRRKINEKFRCLQSIVPGCYKAMGMAVMLDEIINYVQSLQSQVEFLSMKLTAASSFPEFNSEPDIMETMQRAKTYEAMKMQKLESDGCEGVANSTQFGPFDLTFGCYPSLSYNT